MKTCPYCAEEVQDEAIVCKHCGRDLAPEAVALVAQGISRNDVKSDERAKEPRRIHRAHLNPVGELRIQGDKLMDLVHSQQHDGQAIRNDIPAFLDGLSESFSMTQDDKVLRLANGLRETGSILAEEIMEGWSQQVLDTFYFNQREWNKELLALESFVSGKVSTYQYGRPPWYRTSWFYILLIFLPLGQPFFVYLVLTDPSAHIVFKILAWLGLLQFLLIIIIVILALLGPGLETALASISGLSIDSGRSPIETVRLAHPTFASVSLYEDSSWQSYQLVPNGTICDKLGEDTWRIQYSIEMYMVKCPGFDASGWVPAYHTD